MVLSKEELLALLQNEVRLLQHLASKVEPAMLDYRPTPKQRSLLELLQYLTIMGPVHLRQIKSGAFDMPAWSKTLGTEEAAAKERNLEQVKEAIGKQSALSAEVLGSCSDADLRAEIVMFGNKATRGWWFVWLVLSHYAAYRMQLFLYLKACGCDQLSTLNLWAGMDTPKSSAASQRHRARCVRARFFGRSFAGRVSKLSRYRPRPSASALAPDNIRRKNLRSTSFVANASAFR